MYKRRAGYVKLAQNMIRSRHYFSDNGHTVDIPTVSLYTSSLYVEYGISDRLNARVYLPFFVRSTLNKVAFRQSGSTIPGDAVHSFGDTDIGLKYGFFQDKAIVMSVGLTFGLSFGSSEVTSERILQTGDGEFNQVVTLEASHSFYPAPVYVSVLTGFNHRTNGFSEEFRYGAEVGWTGKVVAGILKVNSVNSLYNGDAEDSRANGVFSNNTEYFSITPELIINGSDRLGVAVSSGFATSGKRILASPNFGFGVFYTL